MKFVFADLATPTSVVAQLGDWTDRGRPSRPARRGRLIDHRGYLRLWCVGKQVWRSVAFLLFASLAISAHAQVADDPAVLNAEVLRLHKAGKYPQATEVAKRLLT